jgi:hypothetical protein
MGEACSAHGEMRDVYKTFWNSGPPKYNKTLTSHPEFLTLIHWPRFGTALPATFHFTSTLSVLKCTELLFEGLLHVPKRLHFLMYTTSMKPLLYLHIHVCLL